MNPLAQAVAAIAGWDAARAGDRAQCVALLEQVGTLMQEALTLWQAHIDVPMEHDPRRSVTTLVRPDDAKRLNDIHFKTKEVANRLMELTGAPFIDTFDLCEELAIERAYRQLKLGETIPYVTVKAVETQGQRIAAIEQALAQLRKEP